MLHPTLLACYSSYEKQHLTGKNNTNVYGSKSHNAVLNNNKAVAMGNMGTTFTTMHIPMHTRPIFSNEDILLCTITKELLIFFSVSVNIMYTRDLFGAIGE